MTTVDTNKQNPKIDAIVESFKKLSFAGRRNALAGFESITSEQMNAERLGTKYDTGTQSIETAERTSGDNPDSVMSTLAQFKGLGFADRMATLRALVEVVKDSAVDLSSKALGRLKDKAREINLLVSAAERATEYPGKWFVDGNYCFKIGSSGDGKFVVYLDAIRSYQDSLGKDRFEINPGKHSYVVSRGAEYLAPKELTTYGRSQFENSPDLGQKEGVEFLAQRVSSLLEKSAREGSEIPLPVREMQHALEAGVRIQGHSPADGAWLTGELIATVLFEEVEREGRKEPYWISYSDAGKAGYTAHPALYQI